MDSRSRVYRSAPGNRVLFLAISTAEQGFGSVVASGVSFYMWRILRTCWRKLRVLRYQRRIGHALALHLRGEARRDGLRLLGICNRLEIQWRARDIHPWDRDLPPEAKASMFVEQCMTDTEAAIFRLFEALPYVDVIDLNVLCPTAGIWIMAGTVNRADLDKSGSLASVKMRLRNLSVSYHLARSSLPSLESIW